MAGLSSGILRRAIKARFYRGLIRSLPAHYSLPHRLSMIRDIEVQREGLVGFHVSWATDASSKALLELACLNLATYQVLYSQGFPEHQVLCISRACAEQVVCGNVGRLFQWRVGGKIAPWMQSFFTQNGLPELSRIF